MLLAIRKRRRAVRPAGVATPSSSDASGRRRHHRRRRGAPARAGFLRVAADAGSCADVRGLRAIGELHAEAQALVRFCSAAAAVGPEHVRVEILLRVRVGQGKEVELEARRVGGNAGDADGGGCTPREHELKRHNPGKRPGRRPEPRRLDARLWLWRRFRQGPEKVIAHCSNQLPSLVGAVGFEPTPSRSQRRVVARRFRPDSLCSRAISRAAVPVFCPCLAPATLGLGTRTRVLPKPGDQL